MKNLPLMVLAFLAIGANNVGAQDVRYNFARDANFSNYRTYKWVDIKSSNTVNELAAQQIKAAIEAELATKGLTKTDSDDADLYIGDQTAVRTQQQYNSYSTGWGMGPGWGGGWYGGYGYNGMTSQTTSTIYVGDLVLDMYDSKNKDLVWRGVVNKTIDPKAKPDKQEKNLKKAVAKLLKNYPPPVKK
jgi:hypothetical protein